jgi:peptidoglycan/LPS O-acetylase OafA/YrhL
LGTVRFLLALSVLITHSAPIFGVRLLSGDMAVNSFFVVSGFLMALILETKYVGKIKAFYVNRILRIYPPYFVALAGSIVFFVWLGSNRFHDPVKVFRWFLDAEAWGALAWGALTNLTLIGINLVRVVNLDEQGQFFISLFEEGGFRSHRILFVPQAWTLALELYYYALVPFIVLLRTRYIAALTVGMFVLSSEAYMFLAGDLRWIVPRDALFPFVLKYFLLGTLAYRFVGAAEWLADRSDLVRRFFPAASWLAAIALIFLGLPAYKAWHYEADWFYVAFALCVPGMFIFSGKSRLDPQLGEYSYPVYLFHYPVKVFTSMFLPLQWNGETTLVITMLLATIYIRTIDKRVERLRHRIARDGLRSRIAATAASR